MNLSQRLGKIKDMARLDGKDVESLSSGMDIKIAEMMSENVIGIIKLPLGVATNFLIDGKEYAVPMCIEEPSVVAAASHAAKLARACGGFRTSCTPSVMIGQIQLMGIKEPAKAMKAILSKTAEIKKHANHQDSVMVKLGGGLINVEVRDIPSSRGVLLVVHLMVDVKDAMGANCVNSMCEGVAPYLEKLTGGRSVLKIISNLADRRLVKAEATWKKELIGEDVIEGILDG